MKMYYMTMEGADGRDVEYEAYLRTDVEEMKAGARDKVLSLLDGQITEDDRKNADRVVSAIFGDA